MLLLVRLGIVSVLFLAAAAHAGAQTVKTSPGAAPLESTWRIESGYHWFALRDVARTGHPVDASLVTWQGRGMAVDGQYQRRRGSGLQRVDVALAFAGDFAYRSPISSTPAVGDDRYRAVDMRYEYRRYLFNNLGLRGLAMGIGAQAMGVFTSASRHVPVDLVSEYSTAGTGPGLVLAARLQRWSKVSGEVTWSNAGVFARVSGRDGDAFSSTPTRWGGGWISALTVSAEVHVSRQTKLAVKWDQSRDGLLSSHQNWTTSHGTFVAGVTYAK